MSFTETLSKTEKACSRCAVTKSLSEFATDRSRPDGTTGICSACRNARFKEIREADPERFRQYSRAWGKKNPEKEKAQNKQRYARDKSRMQEVAKKWREQHRERTREIERRSRFMRLLDPGKLRRKRLADRLYYLRNAHKWPEREARYRDEGRHPASNPLSLNGFLGGSSPRDGDEISEKIADTSAACPQSSLLFSELVDWLEERTSEGDRQLLDAYMDCDFDLDAAACECGLSITEAGNILSRIQAMAAKEIGTE